ncbi:MAG TPA: response regulator [Candidatus Hydrogenedentes bacterium]|nr:response regulator [Candidatus Hydrogenedentota bacterium]HOT50487.1 response regulator [Candidatus Hydrogenedentota bacterium]HOV74853.1 response regulator [Candidatus Hydrogenedentota bacterium]HPC15141.1 response regulator [Candidatus Hydrogenedentota bacterium]HRT19604.1 response regulator [Candidatus Hydrogenedentota bacterium]
MSTKKTIMVVDDDSDYRFQQRVQLEASGYAVIEADSAEQAMEELEKTRPDLALVDLMMEEMDAGFTLCYHIKKKYPDVPIILATAVTRETGLEFDASTSEERSWIKADVLLAKPIRFDQLRREIERLLGVAK